MKESKVKCRWVKPALVRKPVSETMQGGGANSDGTFGELPVQS
jgi:hypothetical protein